MSKQVSNHVSPIEEPLLKLIDWFDKFLPVDMERTDDAYSVWHLEQPKLGGKLVRNLMKAGFQLISKDNNSVLLNMQLNASSLIVKFQLIEGQWLVGAYEELSVSIA